MTAGPPACGVDVGGTKIAVGVVDAEGTILDADRAPTPSGDSAALVATIGALVRPLVRAHRVGSVGIGAAGFVDKGRSRVLFAPNIAWRDEDLGAAVAEQVGLPVVVENDANAAAWGEFTWGAGRDVDDLLLVTVGTGVGGGLVLDGEPYRGGAGVAAEIGHLRVVPRGRPCGCGNLGCWEQYASGNALARDAREAAAAGGGRAARLLELAGGRAEGVSGRMVTGAAREGDPLAQELLAGVGRWLGEGIASLVAVLDPTVVVVGGGLSEEGDLFLDPVRAAVSDQLTGKGHRPAPLVRQAELGNDAGLIGAADLSRRGARR